MLVKSNLTTVLAYQLKRADQIILRPPDSHNVLSASLLFGMG